MRFNFVLPRLLLLVLYVDMMSIVNVRLFSGFVLLIMYANRT